MSKIARYLCFIVLLSLLSVTHAESSPSNFSSDFWTLFGGYGISHKGLGATRTSIHAVNVTLQYAHFLKEIRGDHWFRGRHHLLIEVPVNFVTYPAPAIIAGVNFFASWTFTSSEKYRPFVFAGGGPAYTNLKTSGIGSEFNASYQAGGGVLLPLMGRKIIVNYRIIHISNGGIAEPNEPINSSFFLIGIPLMGDY